ncbi:MAG: ECF transporter S component [Clostridiales Family XIII bacterium]|nr:ECF transporter S component [Clostridiales Family XIII bacterium]
MRDGEDNAAGRLNVRRKTIQIAKMGVLGAISIVLVSLIHVSIIPAAPFLEYDPADVPILIAAFAFGPLAGLLLAAVVSLVQGLTVSAMSGPYGILMHIIATGAFVAAAGSVYRLNKSKRMAALALVCGVIAMTAVMIPANLTITPAFTGWPVEEVKALMLPGIIPFNLVKAGLNAIITFVLYKRVSRYLHGGH